MKKLLQSKRRCPNGQDRIWHEQVLRFLEAQIFEFTSPLDPSQGPAGRTTLSLQIARSYNKRRFVAERIRNHEIIWIRERKIPQSQ
jgi:hypothetical protein